MAAGAAAAPTATGAEDEGAEDFQLAEDLAYPFLNCGTAADDGVEASADGLGALRSSHGCRPAAPLDGAFQDAELLLYVLAGLAGWSVPMTTGSALAAADVAEGAGLTAAGAAEATLSMYPPPLLGVAVFQLALVLLYFLVRSARFTSFQLALVLLYFLVGPDDDDLATIVCGDVTASIAAERDESIISAATVSAFEKVSR